MATDAPSFELVPAPQGRLHAAWRFLLFVLLYLFFVFGLGLVAGAVFSRTVLVTVLAGFPAAVLATAFMLGAVDQRPASFVGLGLGSGWARELGAGFLLGLVMIAAIVLLEWITGHLRLVATGAPTAAGLRRLLAFFLVFLAGAAHEELVARGYPFQRLREVLGTALAVLAQAAVFAALHYNNPHASPVGTLNTMLVGILFALAYLNTGRLWLPIGLHWSWNFFEAAFGFPVSGIKIEVLPLSAQVSGRELFHGGAYGPEASLPASGVFLAVNAALILWRKRPGAAAPSNEVA